MGLNSEQIKRIASAVFQRHTAQELDETAVTELVLYAQNDGDLYQRYYQPISNNMAKKYEKGIYDPDAAIKGWMYFIDAAAKQYHQEFGSPNLPWHSVFPKAVRLAAAQEIADEWLTEYEIQHGSEDEGAEDWEMPEDTYEDADY